MQWCTESYEGIDGTSIIPRVALLPTTLRSRSRQRRIGNIVSAIEYPFEDFAERQLFATRGTHPC